MGSAEIALNEARNAGFTEGLVLASDGFLPFDDTVALAAKYGTDGLASAELADCAWCADALGIRFYINSDAVSKEKRNEIGDYSSGAITAALPYDALPGAKAAFLASVPDSYIAMIDRETVYGLPHGKQSVLLTEKDGETFIRITEDGGKVSELRI